MIRFLLLFVVVVWSSSLHGQTWESVKVVLLKEPITSMSVDQEGSVYLGTEKGNLIRYNDVLTDEVYFSEINLSPVTMVEAWNRLKIVLFFRENQKVLLLDRFATRPRDLFDGVQFEGFIQMAAPGTDNSYWILESRTNELRKYSQQRLLLTSPITNPEIALRDVTYMRAYQNLVILLDRETGFYFFDQYGNYLTKKPLQGCRLFQVFNDKVITFDGTSIISFNPFQPTSDQRLSAPQTNTYDHMLQLSDHTYLFFEQKEMTLYRLIP